MDENSVIEAYFWDGFRYHAILRLLREYHGIEMSYSTLRRRLRELGLARRQQSPPLLQVWRTIIHELQGPGSLGGYRSVCRLLRRRHHMLVPHETVRMLLRQIDPVAVANRRQHRLHRRTYFSRGPCHTWHIDGYDKLRPYGILISGCIDGYSRKIMWLRAANSNHNPAVIASYYMSAVAQYNGYPAQVRTDCGTENVLIAAIQATVTNSASAHIYGTSPGNQRIEGWWSFFRRNRSQWWISLFEDMISFGVYDPNLPRQMDCLRFCFMDVIQSDLDDVRRDWNTHRIRPSRQAHCPAGVPDELFYLPPPPAVQCMIHNAPPLPAEVTEQLEEPGICDNHDLHDYLLYLCNLHQWRHPPVDVNAASELYFNLVNFL